MKAIRKGTGKQFKVFAENKIEAGDVVVVGELAGVAPYAISAGDTGVVDREGEFVLEYNAAAAANQGAKAYWDSSAKKVTATASSNKLLGYFAEAVTATDVVCRVIFA